jgi:hypothetical protein
MINDNIEIVKKSGERVVFDSSKLKQSLERSGAGTEEIEYIIGQVREKIVDGMSTRKLYHIAYSLLRKQSNKVAGRYRLKKAILELGPTGFPFEKFVGELFKHQGYDVQVGVVVPGKCVTHEVDVIARKGKKQLMMECKFHSDTSRKSDVKVPMYISSRFYDVKSQWEKEYGDKIDIYQGWVVTNTRFTQDAINFGRCAGLQLMSWDYPRTGSLRDRIDASGLHPVTALQTLKKAEKQQILDMGIVLCRNLSPNILRDINVSERRINKAITEVRELVGN